MGCTSSLEMTEREIRKPIIKALPLERQSNN